MEFRCCAIVPTYDNPKTIRSVVERIRGHIKDIIVIDDGSAAACREACSALGRDGLAKVIRFEANRGKGAAVRRGLVEAEKAGFSHAFQIDADGQHDLEQIPHFLLSAKKSPIHAILGKPIYDETAPALRLSAREITRFWVDLEVGRGVVHDALIGFRVYPVAQTLALPLRANRMSFDVEVCVLLAWAGVPILNLPVSVRYLTTEEGGLSHFRPVMDNLRLSWLHSRLCTIAAIRWCLHWIPRPARLEAIVMTLREEIGVDGSSEPPPHARNETSDEAAKGKAIRADEDNWLNQRERGAVWLIRLTAFWVGVLGRKPTRVLLRAIAAYYALFDRSAGRASRDWLARVHGRPATFGQVYRHIFSFAQVTLDRLLFVRGRTGALDINLTGTKALEDQVATGQGAFLLGAHLGSMDAMRAEGQNQKLPVSVVGHFENAQMINAVLTSLNPDLSDHVVHAGRDPIGFALTLRDRIAEGGLIAVTVDRVGMNDKFVMVNFFGAPAAFSTGPFILASVLKCPIYLVFGLYFEPNRYELFCERFSDRIELPRRDRDAALKEVVSRYAERLEEYCRRAPDNWFNFFEFWASRSDATQMDRGTDGELSAGSRLTWKGKA